MGLRKGKTKQMLERAIDCGLLAVEVYNKPRAPFRVETFITHMIMAWTKVCHAHFNNTIGNKFYYKEKNSQRYKRVDGEKKAWELKTCISKISFMTEPVKANLSFFIGLRNKIEHQFIDKESVGVKIFGECQSLLNNFEEFVIRCFGEEFALNETLAFSLQFSRLRTNSQKSASKKLLASEVVDLNAFVDKYRTSIPDETFQSQEYSIKLISIPKISNTDRNDLAMEFVNWNLLSDDDRKNYNKLLGIIKDKTIFKEGVNPGKLKAGEVVDKVKKIDSKFSHYDHRCLYNIFSIRPSGKDKKQDPFNTNTNYCHYDEPHDDYLYQEDWCSFLIEGIQSGKLNKELWKTHFDNHQKLQVSNFKHS